MMYSNDILDDVLDDVLSVRERERKINETCICEYVSHYEYIVCVRLRLHLHEFTIPL